MRRRRRSRAPALVLARLAGGGSASHRERPHILAVLSRCIPLALGLLPPVPRALVAAGGALITLAASIGAAGLRIASPISTVRVAVLLTLQWMGLQGPGAFAWPLLIEWRAASRSASDGAQPGAARRGAPRERGDLDELENDRAARLGGALLLVGAALRLQVTRCTARPWGLRRERRWR